MCLYLAGTFGGLFVGDNVSVQGGRETAVALEWNADGSLIALALEDGAIQVSDVRSGELISNLDVTTHPSISWHPLIEDRLAVSGINSPIQILNVITGQLLMSSQDEDDTFGVAFSPDGTLLATSHGTPGGGLAALGIIKIRDAATGELLSTLRDVGQGVFSVNWNPTGDKIAGESVYSAVIWDATTGDILTTISDEANAIRGLAWSPDSARLATVRILGLQVWETTTDQPLFTALEYNPMEDVAWSPDGASIAVAGHSGIQIINAQTGELVETVSVEGNPNLVTWSPDGTQLAYGGFGGAVEFVIVSNNQIGEG